MVRVKLLMLAPNLQPGKLGISGSPTFNQSSLCLMECVSGARVRDKSHAAQRACSHLCSASPGAALSVPHLPEEQHKACPLCSCFQAVSSPSTAKPASGGSSASSAHSTQLPRGTRGALCSPSFSPDSSQAQGRIPVCLHSDNTAFQKGNTK